MFNELAAGFNRLVRNGYRKLKGLYSLLFSRGSILVLCKEIDFNHSGIHFRIKEYGTDASEIIDVYKSVGRYNCDPGSDDDTRVASRIRNGMKFYAAFQGDMVIAYLWLHSVSHRFFDEIGVFVKHGSNDLWLRDVYVVPEKRGQRVFGTVISAIIREYYPDSCTLYSDVMSGNKASLAAHENLGLTVVGHVRFTRILGRVLYRKIDVKDLDAYGYKYPQKVLLMNNDFRLFIDFNRS